MIRDLVYATRRRNPAEVDRHRHGSNLITTKMESEAPLEKALLSPFPNTVPKWVMPVVKALIIATDGLIAFATFVTAFSIRESAPVFGGAEMFWSPQFAPYSSLALAAIPIRLIFLAYYEAYKLKGSFSFAGEILRLARAVVLGSLALIAIAFLFRGGYRFRDFSYSRGVFLLDLLFAFLAVGGFHLLLRAAQIRVRASGINLIPTLIVGTNKEASQTIKILNERRDLGYRVVGVVVNGGVTGPSALSAEEFEGVKIVGPLSELPRISKAMAIQEVVITDTEIPREALFEVLMESDRSDKVEYKLAPSLLNYLPQKASVEQIGVLPVITLFREPLSETDRFLKRASDVAIALTLLVIFGPLMLLVAFFIRSGSAGPALFRQERVGMDGRRFLFYKFRTMYEDADDSIHREVYRKNIAGGETETGEFHGKVRNDPRITQIGALLRRTSIDELPQLLNVIKGEMSIVGPRPPIPYEVEEYRVWHRDRLDMKPGMTGLWQVSGRNKIGFDEMVKLDLFYIENWSLWLDLKIVLLTVPAVIRGEGERGNRQASSGSD